MKYSSICNLIGFKTWLKDGKRGMMAHFADLQAPALGNVPVSVFVPEDLHQSVSVLKNGDRVTLTQEGDGKFNRLSSVVPFKG